MHKPSAELVTSFSQQPRRRVPRIVVHRLEPKVIFKGRVTRQLVILIHGSHSLGRWQDVIGRELDTGGFNIDVRAVKFTGVSLFGALLWPLRRWTFQDICDQISSFSEISPDHDRSLEITFIAHSYGTFMLAKFLGMLPFGTAARVILLASIARNSDIDKMSKRAAVIINDVCIMDRVPCWAEAFRWSYFQATGVFGAYASRAKIINRYFDGGHSTHVEIDHFRKEILPILRGENVPETKHSGPAAWVGYVDFVRFGIPALFLGIVAAIFLR